MDFRHLKTLVAIAEHKSFAAAADAIGLTQSAVSLHVKAVEDQLQTTLFDRTTRPPLLNTQGTALVEKAREIIGLCDGLTDSLRGERVVGSVELGVIPTALTGILPDALVALRASHPELRIRVTSDLSADLAEAVRRGSLDVAVVSEPTHLAAGLSWHPIVSEPLMVIAPQHTPMGPDREPDRALLESLPFLQFKRFAWAGRLIDTHPRERGIHVRPGMVSRGLGVSIAPMRAMAEPFPENVRAVPFGDPPLMRNIGLIERSENAKIDMVKALYETLIAACARASIA